MRSQRFFFWLLVSKCVPCFWSRQRWQSCRGTEAVFINLSFCILPVPAQCSFRCFILAPATTRKMMNKNSSFFSWYQRSYQEIEGIYVKWWSQHFASRNGRSKLTKGWSPFGALSTADTQRHFEHEEVTAPVPLAHPSVQWWISESVK